MRRNVEDSLEHLREIAEERIAAPDLRAMARRAKHPIRRNAPAIRFAAGAAALLILLTGGFLAERRPLGGPGPASHAARVPKAPWLPLGQPASAIALPALPALTAGPAVTTGPEVPVVRVGTTNYSGTGGSQPGGPLPPTHMLLPRSVAGELAVYQVPYLQGGTLAFLLPRGLEGSAEIATDGSFSVDLQSSRWTVRIFSDAMCSGCAADGGAPYFAKARRDAAQYGGYHGTTLAQLPVGIDRIGPRALAYAYANVWGRPIYGLARYAQAPAVGPGGIFYTVSVAGPTDGSGKALAGYILASVRGTLSPPQR